MEIAVHPDGAIVIKAPLGSDFTLIESKIKKRSRWIIKQLNYFKQFTPKTPARCYINGETHLYLGKQYRLKIVKGDAGSVKLLRGWFYITVHDASSDLVKSELYSWYREKAGKHFTESFQMCWRKMNLKGIDIPQLSIKRMKKRWGSLSENGVVTLNIELIKAPKECLDYVITHELCHLKYNNHSTEFYKLLYSVLPDWEKVKHRLELSVI